PAACRKKSAYLIPERHYPRLVLFDKRHPGEDQCGIDGIIQKTHAVEGHFHHTSLVDDAIDLLAFLISIFVHHKLAAFAGRRLPVDIAYIIPCHIFLYLLELQALSQSAYPFITALRQVVRCCQELEMPEGKIGRQNFYHLFRWQYLTSDHQSKRALDK